MVRAGIAERTRSESVATWAERAETCASVRARRARRARYASEDSNSGGVGDIAGGPMAGGGVGVMERREYVKNCGMTEAIAPPRHFQAPRRHGIWTEPQRPHIYPTNSVKPDTPCLCRWSLYARTRNGSDMVAGSSSRQLIITQHFVMFTFHKWSRTQQRSTASSIINATHQNAHTDAMKNSTSCPQPLTKAGYLLGHLDVTRLLAALALEDGSSVLVELQFPCQLRLQRNVGRRRN